MIEVTRMQVRAHGELGTPFVSTAGVRQGCPASPVLFGILIDRLEAREREKERESIRQ